MTVSSPSKPQTPPGVSDNRSTGAGLGIGPVLGGGADRGTEAGDDRGQQGAGAGQRGDQASAAAARAQGTPSAVPLARALLEAEAKAVASQADRLGPDFDQAVGLLVACAKRNGSVLVSGLGKSGLVGAKISATLASLGIPSHFIHPVEAAHGDLGNFRTDDLCLALSYSGETDEVLSLAACLRQDGIDVIGICAGAKPGPDGQSHPSGLQRLSTVCLTIGWVDQPIVVGGNAPVPPPAPLASTTAMLAIGDCLALCASSGIRFTRADFAKRHPGGSLGGMLRPVVEAMRFVAGKNLHTVPDDLSVEEALRVSESAQRRPGAMLLVDRASGRLTGILTDADVRRLILRDPTLLSQPVARHMTRNPSSLPDSARLADAVHIVQEFRRDEIPVVDERGVPVGILDVQDLIAMRLVND